MYWFETHLEIVVIGFLIAVSAVIILQQRRSPQSTLAWLLFLVLLPYLAIPFFFVMGFRKHRKSIPIDPLKTSLPPSIGPETPQIARMLWGYGLGAASPNNKLQLLPEFQQAWDALLSIIASAERSVDVTLYALGDDEVGRAFCAALEDKARQGVSVRVILDSIGSLRRPRAALSDLTTAGAEVRLYSPLLHNPRGGRLNLRNHRKMVIADGVRVWAGGRNVAEHYLGPKPMRDRWHDLSCRIDGPIAATYAEIFQSDWTEARGKMPPPPLAQPPHGDGGTSMHFVPAGPDIEDDPLHDALVFACHTARRRMWVVTPYFLPTPALSDALAMAARRGVDVRILIPAKSNQRLADLARGAWLRELEACGCHIHRHPEMVHAKAVLADDLAFIGSANFDSRSLLLNFEAMVLLYDPVNVGDVAHWIEGLRADTTLGWPQVSFARRCAEGVFRLGSPIL